MRGREVKSNQTKPLKGKRGKREYENRGFRNFSNF